MLWRTILPTRESPFWELLEAEAFQIKALVFEWFGIAAARLPEADRGRISADGADWWSA